MKRKKKKLKKNKSIKSKRLKYKKTAKKRKKNNIKKSNKKRIVKKRIVKKRRKKIKIKKKKIIPLKSKRKKVQKTRAVVSGILSLSDKIKLMLRFNFNLDKSLQNFFQGISNKIYNLKKIMQEEREKQKQSKILTMEREKA